MLELFFHELKLLLREVSEREQLLLLLFFLNKYLDENATQMKD